MCYKISEGLIFAVDNLAQKCCFSPDGPRAERVITGLNAALKNQLKHCLNTVTLLFLKFLK